MTKLYRVFGLVFAVMALASVASAQSAWKSQDIGLTAAGTTAVRGTTITIEGNGSDISGTADAFRLVYQLAEGDCEIQARVVSQEDTHEWAKAGLMIRQSLTPGSKHVHINRNPGVLHGLEFQYRMVENGTTSASSSPHLNTLPMWLRLVRTGGAFRAYYALDMGGKPGTWAQHGLTIPMTMTNPVYIGPTCLSHVQGTLSTAVFDNVRTTGTVKVGAGFIIGEAGPMPTPPRATGVLARAYASLFGFERAAAPLGPASGRLAALPSLRIRK